ncbi:hypothetical protein AM593_08466, partial [Mytilus galloprovincialis]
MFTHTVTLTPLWSTDKFVSSFREGDTVQFTCTGNIGKPPGRFVWQIIPQQGEPIFYSNETTVVIDQIPDICSFRGTSNLTVGITADHFKAKVRCFEESQANAVRHITVTKQPNKAQYDQKTSTINLTCSGDGNPEPTYNWFRQENRSSILSWTNLYIIEDVIKNNSDLTNHGHQKNQSHQRLQLREQNYCQKLTCNDSNVNAVTHSTVSLTELDGVSDVNKESKNNSRS